ncbi:tetratricopeptide repeat protein, partial [Dolichospermum sp. ST_sed10]|nr:tetratricopeptide repeat protein [Dolichospermum sp. ST_sed10]
MEKKKVKKYMQSDEPDYDSSGDILLLAGCHFFFVSGKDDAAMICLNESLRMNPLRARAWYTKGFILMQHDKLEQALQCYDKALDLKPDFDVVWSHKAGVLEKL